MKKIFQRIGLVSGLLLVQIVLGATPAQEIQKIVASKTQPTGVVFEIVLGDDGLRKAIPEIKNYVSQLKAKHPKIKIAVVSHGREQFALQKKHQKKYQAVHKEVKELVKLDVPVHICEKHASWRGVQPEDFPKYVSVSSQGPQEVRNYVEFGYKLIVLRRKKR